MLRENDNINNSINNRELRFSLNLVWQKVSYVCALDETIRKLACHASSVSSEAVDSKFALYALN